MEHGRLLADMENLSALFARDLRGVARLRVPDSFPHRSIDLNSDSCSKSTLSSPGTTNMLSRFSIYMIGSPSTVRTRLRKRTGAFTGTCSFSRNASALIIELSNTCVSNSIPCECSDSANESKQLPERWVMFGRVTNVPLPGICTSKPSSTKDLMARFLVPSAHTENIRELELRWNLLIDIPFAVVDLLAHVVGCLGMEGTELVFLSITGSFRV